MTRTLGLPPHVDSDQASSAAPEGGPDGPTGAEAGLGEGDEPGQAGPATGPGRPDYNDPSRFMQQEHSVVESGRLGTGPGLAGLSHGVLPGWSPGRASGPSRASAAAALAVAPEVKLNLNLSRAGGGTPCMKPEPPGPDAAVVTVTTAGCHVARLKLESLGRQATGSRQLSTARAILSEFS